MPDVTHVVEGLHHHDAAVDNAGPHSKPNETKVLEWVTSRQDEKYPQGSVYAHDHLEII
jgi:hypothetical protein